VALCPCVNGFQPLKDKCGTSNLTTQCRILEDLNPQLNLCENLESRSEYFKSNKDMNKTSNFAFDSRIVLVTTNAEAGLM
jgi:hypothetical protein